jgi:hypothetical protein
MADDVKTNDIAKIFEKVKADFLTEDIREELQVLFEAKLKESVNGKIVELEKLYEEYKTEKTATLNESISKLDEEYSQFKTEKTQQLEEDAVKYVDSHLIDKIDEYLDYSADNYFKENKLAIDEGLKANMYEKVISSVKKILAENQIEESKVEEQEDIFNENKKLKESVNDGIKDAIGLKKEVKTLKAEMALNEVAEGLTTAQKSKLKSLCEDYSLDDLESYKKKANIIKKNLLENKDETVITENKDVEVDTDVTITDEPKEDKSKTSSVELSESEKSVIDGSLQYLSI